MKVLIVLLVAAVAVANASPTPSGWGGLGWGGWGGWAGHGPAALVGPSSAALVAGPHGTGAIASKQIGGVVAANPGWGGWGHGGAVWGGHGW